MIKVGIVALRPMPGGRWQLRYTDPHTQQDVRRRVSGLPEKEVRQMAMTISSGAFEKKGYLPTTLPSLPAAIKQALACTRASAATNSERRRRFDRFIMWLADHYGHVQAWDQLKPHMVREYVIARERESKAYDTVRLDLAIIKQVWNYMAENYPDAIHPIPRIRIGIQPSLRIECLTSEEMLMLLGWLEARVPSLWPMAALCGLAGLRVMEAATLMPADVDFAAGTIDIHTNERHAVKTRSSTRTLPVCEEVLRALRSIPRGRDWLFLDENGNPQEFKALSRRWTRVLRSAGNQLHIERLGPIPIRKLRATFATLIGSLGIDEGIAQRYVGHSPQTILARHYQRVSVEQLRVIPATIDVWLKSVKK